MAKIWCFLEETGQTAVGPAVRPVTSQSGGCASVRPSTSQTNGTAVVGPTPGQTGCTPSVRSAYSALFMFLWVSANHAYSAFPANARMYSLLSGMETTISIHACSGWELLSSLTWCFKMCFLSKKESLMFMLYCQCCVDVFSSSILYLLSILYSLLCFILF